MPTAACRRAALRRLRRRPSRWRASRRCGRAGCSTCSGCRPAAGRGHRRGGAAPHHRQVDHRAWANRPSVRYTVFLVALPKQPLGCGGLWPGPRVRGGTRELPFAMAPAQPTASAGRRRLDSTRSGSPSKATADTGESNTRCCCPGRSRSRHGLHRSVAMSETGAKRRHRSTVST